MNLNKMPKMADKKKITISLAVIIALTIGLAFSPNLNISHPKICIQTNCFDIELASTAKQREQGLMNVKYLAVKSGMLFIFNKQDSYTFWMKNTLIPLDMIRIDKNKTIVDIQTATPCTTAICPTYGGTQAASYVLEINAGLSQKQGLKIGDKVEISY